MVGIKEVAQKAKVSTSTVSRALNGSPRISEATQKRVREAALALGYYPNSIAKSLRQQKAGTIITVLNDIRNPVFADMLKGMEDAAYRSGYSLLIGNTDNSLAREERYLADFLSRKADGIILITSRVDTQRITDLAQAMPVVLINDSRRIPGIPVVGIDDYLASYEMAEYLVQKGYRSLAYVGGGEKAGIALKRRQAFTDCMLHNGITHTAMLSTGVTMQHGCDALDTLIRRPEGPPAAVMCYNDEIAIGVMHRARELNILVPDQMAVCGFDDISTARIVHPSLTTVNQPTCEVGGLAANLLLGLLEGKTPEKQIVYLPHRLCVREST